MSETGKRNTQTTFKALTLIPALLLGSVLAVGCQDKGPAERAGEDAGRAIDDTVDRAREGAENVADDIDDALD